MILSFLTPLGGGEERHEDWRQGVGVKPVLNIAISSSHSLLSLHSWENQEPVSESAWLISRLPLFFVPAPFENQRD